MKKHILIVDDEEHLADALAHNLQFEGFSTTVAFDGEEGLSLARTIQFDLVILDIMMPKLDGLEVCRRLRATGSRVPILFLTAKAADADRLLGLKVGADDYVAKPFLLEELILRIHGIFRRQEWYSTAPADQEIFRFGENEVNFLTYEATTGGRTVSLTEKECMLMKLLVERRNQVVSGRRSWRESGATVSRPRHGPLTISLFGCAGTSRRIPRNRSTFTPCVAWDTASPVRIDRRVFAPQNPAGCAPGWQCRGLRRGGPAGQSCSQPPSCWC